ncbi:PTS sugar transporter subunit IIA [Gracilibacillus alcaliphilus]|uniref:PTS sugar transporter subunit IIA n=1 Tax=Gracilibacillus alcaliphilus TaxID=1401441 RepID=UPI00195A0391|nr:PTS glucose transporter subunit IIA [Gracilibacillus alcaliphilus]
MLGKLFKKKKSDMNIVAPMTGRIMALAEVPDQVFSQKMMGEGIALEPNTNEVLSPIDGKVVDVFRTKHAISMIADNGAEVLIHMGLETVELDGKGFEIHVTNGQKIGKGDHLATFDIETVAAEGYKIITPLIILNSNDYEVAHLTSEQHAEAGQTNLFQVDKK